MYVVRLIIRISLDILRAYMLILFDVAYFFFFFLDRISRMSTTLVSAVAAISATQVYELRQAIITDRYLTPQKDPSRLTEDVVEAFIHILYIPS